jgi:hypothetical protein
MYSGNETQSKKTAKPKRPKRKAAPPKKQPKKDSSSEVNYNSEKYHKKQHSL